MTKICSCCKQELPVENFYIIRRDRYMARCKACKKRLDRERSNSPEARRKRKKNQHEYYMKNKVELNKKAKVTRDNRMMAHNEYYLLRYYGKGRCTTCDKIKPLSEFPSGQAHSRCRCLSCMKPENYSSRKWLSQNSPLTIHDIPEWLVAFHREVITMKRLLKSQKEKRNEGNASTEDNQRPEKPAR